MSTSTTTTTTTKVINTNRSELSRRLSLSGLQIHSNALTFFEAELKHGLPPYESVDDFITQLTHILLTKMSIESMIISGEVATRAVEVLREERRLNASASQMVDSKEWIVIKNVVESKEDVKNSGHQFSSQYGQLVAALKKLAVFESGQFKLTTIDELNCYDSSLEFKCILFALVRKDPSKILSYILEDPTGKVPVSFSKEVTNYREWATFDNGIYLIEGIYDAQRDCFLVKSIGLPPPITSMLPEPETQLNSATKDSMVIVLADIYLDKPKTLEALKFLFTGYSQVDRVPEVFVLMGDFTEERVDQFDLKDHMKNLVKLIGTFRRLANQSRFVFVPGPNDLLELPAAGSSQHDSAHESILSAPFTADHFPTTTTKLRHYYLASNPFHLQIQGRNLSLYNSPVVSQSMKNVIHSPLSDHHHQSDRSALVSARHVDAYLSSLGRLLVSSAHLQAGINRNYLSGLSLFPRIADCLLFADPQYGRFNQVAIHDSAVHFATVGSFSRDNGQFACYYVDTNEVEESQVSV